MPLNRQMSGDRTSGRGQLSASDANYEPNLSIDELIRDYRRFRDQVDGDLKRGGDARDAQAAAAAMQAVATLLSKVLA